MRNNGRYGGRGHREGVLMPAGRGSLNRGGYLGGTRVGSGSCTDLRFNKFFFGMGGRDQG